jgi:YD repeat-containing protein
VQETDEQELEMREVFDYQDARLVLFERYDSGSQLIHQARNTYADGKLVQTDISSSENEEPYTQVIRYNAAGRRIEDMKYDNQGRLIERNRSEEDETGRVVKLIEENTFRSHTTGLEYNDAGRLVRQVEKDLLGNLVSDIERTYTEEGLPESAHITVRDRSTGTYQQYYLIYEYEFFEELS